QLILAHARDLDRHHQRGVALVHLDWRSPDADVGAGQRTAADDQGAEDLFHLLLDPLRAPGTMPTHDQHECPSSTPTGSPLMSSQTRVHTSAAPRALARPAGAGTEFTRAGRRTSGRFRIHPSITRTKDFCNKGNREVDIVHINR